MANHLSNLFEVWNVNDEHVVLSRGVMEVTSTDLIHTTCGSTRSITWSLKYLRRLGCEGNIFCFEAGRKCTTGEGFYAFKCTRAAELFYKANRNIMCGILQPSDQRLPAQYPLPVPSEDIGYDIAWDFSRLQPKTLPMKLTVPSFTSM